MGISQCLVRCVDALYIPVVRRFISRDIFGYGLCGGTNMVLDTIWYFVIYHYIVCERYINLDFIVVSPHIASLCIVFPITFFTGFWLNRNVAFRVTHLQTRRQLIRYGLSVIGSIVINYVCMKLFVEIFHIWPTPSKMLTTLLSVVYSFLAAKYFTFADKTKGATSSKV